MKDEAAASPEQAWREWLRSYIQQECRPLEKFGHQPRLYALACEIGASLDYDDDVVYAAAWLHDLGVFYRHRPDDLAELAHWDNVQYAIERAPAILEQSGFPAGKVEAVVEAIRTHQAQAEPGIIEAIVLRDADILEQLGAIGILRAVCKVGRDTRYQTFTSVTDVLRRAASDLPGQLRLPSSRNIAQRKVELLKDFLSGVDRESYGALF